MGKLDGKVIIVSGASSGIGAGTAEVLADEGAKVVIFARSSKLDATSQKLEAKGYDFLALRGDATSEEDWANIVKQAVAKYGRIDGLFNNAGGYDNLAKADATYFGDNFSLDAWHDQFEKQFFSQLKGIRACLPELRKTKGCIICNSSITVVRSVSVSAYACAKAAALTLVKSLAKELGPEGIRINCVIPGWVKSHLTPYFDSPDDPIGQILNAQTWLEHHPGEPADVGHAVAFLASDDAKYLTGIEIIVDGGFSL